MVKKKLNVLSQAGLNKSDFDNTVSHEAAKLQNAPIQSSIRDYFQVRNFHAILTGVINQSDSALLPCNDVAISTIITVLCLLYLPAYWQRFMYDRSWRLYDYVLCAACA